MGVKAIICCDRCGKQVAEVPVEGTAAYFNPILVNLLADESRTKYKVSEHAFELCPDCMEEFKRFLMPKPTLPAEADRHCGNCRYMERRADRDPCKSCGRIWPDSAWEPQE